MCKSIYVQTNSSAIGYWQEHWGCVSLKRGGGAILMLSFIFVSFLSWDSPWEGQVTCLLVKSLERKMGLWVLFDARELLSLCPLSQSFWTIREFTWGVHWARTSTWKMKFISHQQRRERLFFRFKTIYNHRSMLFHNRNKVVNLTMLTHLDAFTNEIQEEE